MGLWLRDMEALKGGSEPVIDVDIPIDNVGG